ncbi:hypothetical protein KP509_33G050900 [Ceratopteris richardii]|uniref:VASt domain-containing protein n=1 Tax=Ceratopteris richardii TaxID=49495 RepID=A0A8T2QQ00_CERRI|nr:hypothetical protein KP509_33G050900 [Ceratopteris richardii]
MINGLKNWFFSDWQLVFRLLFEDDAFIKFYHEQVTHDSNASATAWSDENGCKRRTVTFSLHAPSRFQTILGGYSSPVTEIQEYRKVDDTIIILSKLSIIFSVATVIIMWKATLSPNGDGCTVVLDLTVEPQSRFLMFLLREAKIESAASLAFKRWMNIARIFCERRMGIEEEPLLSSDDVSPSETILLEGNSLDSDEPVSEGREASTESGTYTHHVGHQAKFSVPEHNWLYYVKNIQKIICSIWGNLWNARVNFDRKLKKQSNFHSQVLGSLGLGAITGFVCSFLSRKHSCALGLGVYIYFIIYLMVL